MTNDTSLLEAIRDPLFLSDSSGRATFFNRAAQDWFGVTFAGKMLSETVELVGFPLQIEDLTAIVDRDGHWRGEAQVRLGEDQSKWVEWSLQRVDTDPSGPLFMSLFRDITTAKHMETDLRRENADLNGILDSISEGVFVRGADMELRYCNKGLQRITGFNAEDIRHPERLLRIWHPGDVNAFLAAGEAFMLEGGIFDFEGRYVRKDGAVRWCRNRSWWTDAKRHTMVGTVEDITPRKEAELALEEVNDKLEQRVEARTAELVQAKRDLEADIAAREKAEDERDRLEQELRRSQTLEAVGRLAGGVAHDFNNLIGSILGCLYGAQTQLKTKPEVALEELIRIQDLCRHGGEITRQLLTVARRKMGRTESVPVAALLNEVVALLQRSLPKSISVTCECKPGLDSVRGDRALLTTALLNLGLNARDAMSRGGSLVYSARVVDQFNGNTVVIEVVDTGVGIPEGIRDQVFEPFFTTKSPDEGTGLGLAMVYATVKECGGDIRVSSSGEEGARITMELPVHRPHVNDGGVISIDASILHPLVDGPVLIVEDEDDVGRMMANALDSSGYKVLRARTGLEALETVKDRREDLALVALDLMLPEIGGEDVHRFLRSLVPELPILFTTGREDLARRLDETTPLLAKPFSGQEFLVAVASVLQTS